MRERWKVLFHSFFYYEMNNIHQGMKKKWRPQFIINLVFNLNQLQVLQKVSLPKSPKYFNIFSELFFNNSRCIRGTVLIKRILWEFHFNKFKKKLYFWDFLYLNYLNGYQLYNFWVEFIYYPVRNKTFCSFEYNKSFWIVIISRKT